MTSGSPALVASDHVRGGRDGGASAMGGSTDWAGVTVMALVALGGVALVVTGVRLLRSARTSARGGSVRAVVGVLLVVAGAVATFFGGFLALLAYSLSS